MLGLARMAMSLAVNRAYGHLLADWKPDWAPVERRAAYDHAHIFPAAYNYYVICDRITRGEKP